MSDRFEEFRHKVIRHLQFIYPEEKSDELADKLISAMGFKAKCKKVKPYKNHWNQKDIVAITYGDTFVKENEKPLHTLKEFLNHFLKDKINSIHILPFYPYSSDDGFSVINYKQVNDALGDWGDINHIAKDYKLMADLVVNHCSSRSQWFEQFKQNKSPGNSYFIDIDKDQDVSNVTRPRTNPLLQEVETSEGKKHVWCTFSHDQIDLNFSNPDLLIEMVSIISFYLNQGVKIFRLDAIAFLWKELGTTCLNLPKTHEMVRLFRTLIEHKKPKTIVITETNIPNRENLAYFGNTNEAHVIYNFALPPLLIHGLLTGNSFYLNNWLMSMPPAQDGTTYLNFIASHDGIGLRPVEGILSESQIDDMVATMQLSGGKISWRNLSNDEVRPYEINISLYDALKRTNETEDAYQYQRFICAHTIMLGLEGIPAFYIHSLFATENDYKKLEATSHNRSINRRSWDYEELTSLLNDSNSHHSQVLNEILRVVEIRKKQSAFHPNATQYTLHLGEGVFGFWRQSRKRDQSIFCIHNIQNKEIEISMQSINLVDTQSWIDLLSGSEIDNDQEKMTLKPYQCLWISN